MRRRTCKHATELEYANLVASHLGIERHHVFRFSKEDYLNAIPEMVPTAKYQ